MSAEISVSLFLICRTWNAQHVSTRYKEVDALEVSHSSFERAFVITYY